MVGAPLVVGWVLCLTFVSRNFSDKKAHIEGVDLPKVKLFFASKDTPELMWVTL